MQQTLVKEVIVARFSQMWSSLHSHREKACTDNYYSTAKKGHFSTEEAKESIRQPKRSAARLM